MIVVDELFRLQDIEYADFQSKLVPTIPRECFIGVRIPKMRLFVKKYLKEEQEEMINFLEKVPHKYYEENILHALLLSEWKEYSTVLEWIEQFLPYIDNWAVCDILTPKVFSKNKPLWFSNMCDWIRSENTFTCRFGIRMLMNHYLDEDFKESYFDVIHEVKSEDYYVKMGVAWFLATALAKQWNSTVAFLSKNTLDTWTHNKTIQKAKESYRLNQEQKEYLITLKRK